MYVCVYIYIYIGYTTYVDKFEIINNCLYNVYILYIYTYLFKKKSKYM